MPSSPKESGCMEGSFCVLFADSLELNFLINNEPAKKNTLKGYY